MCPPPSRRTKGEEPTFKAAADAVKDAVAVSTPSKKAAYAPQKVDWFYRYNQPSEALPDQITLDDIRKVLPAAVFQKSDWEGFKCCVTTFTFTAIGIYLVHLSPWFLLPFAWFFAGTAATGLFVIGHDCGHRSFSSSNTVNNFVGTLAMMPLVYPFHAWRLGHNQHHRYTNQLVMDNAWHPFESSDYNSVGPVTRFIYRTIKGPMWWFASVGHQIKTHFSPSSFAEGDRPGVRQSLFWVYLFMATVLLPLVYFHGFWALIKYWAMPFLGYHFWMSTFTMLHHTAVDIPFKSKEEWNAAQAQLSGTVHIDYPAWIEYLCHNINVHVPHHVSTSIPSYRLKAAHTALKTAWGKHMICSRFCWSMLKDVITRCHLFHEHHVYTPFEPSAAEYVQ